MSEPEPRKLTDCEKRSLIRLLKLSSTEQVVLDEIEVAMQTYLHSKYYMKSVFEAEAMGIFISEWFWPRKRYSGKGRRRQDELHCYFRTVVRIYERATGEKIKRQVVPVEVNQYESSSRDIPHPFLRECAKLIDHEPFPSGIIKTILHVEHPRCVVFE